MDKMNFAFQGREIKNAYIEMRYNEKYGLPARPGTESLQRTVGEIDREYSIGALIRKDIRDAAQEYCGGAVPQEMVEEMVGLAEEAVYRRNLKYEDSYDAAGFNAIPAQTRRYLKKLAAQSMESINAPENDRKTVGEAGHGDRGKDGSVHLEESVRREIARDIRAGGFQPTKTLVQNMEELWKAVGDRCPLNEVHILYQIMDRIRDPAVRDCVEQIVEECREQELESLVLSQMEI